MTFDDVHTTPPDLEPAVTHYANQERLPMWTVFDHPKDYATGFVARFAFTLPALEKTQFAIFGPTLDAVRNALPEGLVCLSRCEGDDPNIVEVWM